MKYLWLILIVAVAGQASAELKCFQCDNCASVAKRTAKSCGSSPAEPTTTSTPGNSTTTSPIPATNTPITNIPTSPSSVVPTESTTTIVQATTQLTTEQNPASNPDEPSSRMKQYEPTKHEKSANSTFRPQEKLPVAETFNRERRSIKSQRNSTAGYSCYKIHFKGTDGKTQINRGCVVTAKNDNDTCQLLSTSNVAVEKCSLCKKDSCNSSSALMSSMALILASAVIIFFRQF